MFRRASTHRPSVCLLFALLTLAGAVPGHAQSSGDEASGVAGLDRAEP